MRKDGTRFWASVVIDPIRDEHGELIGFAKITRDITERARPRKRCAPASERFRLLVQGVTDYAIYMLDRRRATSPTGTPARERIKGYAADEIVGQHFSRFYTERGPRRRHAGAGAGDRRARRHASRPKAGACARTARASGRTW